VLDIIGDRLGSAIQGLESPEGRLIRGGRSGTVLVQLDMVLKSARQAFWSSFQLGML
jgi:hypothetical protein